MLGNFGGNFLEINKHIHPGGTDFQQPLPNQASAAQQPAQNQQAVASSPQKISEGYRYSWAPFAGAELLLGKALLGGRVYWAGYSTDLSNIALSGLLSAYVAQQKYLLYLHYKLG